jgi:uncharacterized tellurite resistance protein B-like protein
MLTSLLRRLANPDEKGALAEDDARTAVAALLVAAAHADDRYDDRERTQIERVLAARYALNPAAAAALREEGEEAERASIDLFRFTQLIKQGVPHEQRTSVLEALWRVVLADDARDADEEALMRRVTDLLGLDTRDSVEARQRAQAAPG